MQRLLCVHKNAPFSSRMTEREPSIFLSGNSHVEPPLLIPLTFTEQRVE